MALASLARTLRKSCCHTGIGFAYSIVSSHRCTARNGAGPIICPADVELIVGDIRDTDALARALDRIDAVVHLVALVGVGQSMYQIAEYTSVNNLGTAILWEALSKHPVGCLVVASSMSIYGEGLYRDADGNIRAPQDRTLDQLKMADWEVRDEAGRVLTPVATPEDKTPALASVYALSKYDQERLCLILGRAYGIPAVALRFFNTYGPYQALSNPYTGVLSNFASRVLNGNAPLIFEDGLQKRDFVSVYDVARAVPAGAGHAASRGRRVQHLERRADDREGGRRAHRPRDRTSRYSAADHRQVSRRRHPPLLRGHFAREASAGLGAASHAGSRDWKTWRPG